MITVIVATLNDEVGLARLLAALVPAATEGIVRDVVVVDRGSEDGTLVVADAAGCTIVRSGGAAAAVQAARGEWLLFVPPRPDALGPAWQREALAFIDRVMVAGTAGSQSGLFYRGRIRSGVGVRLFAMLAGGGASRLIAKSAWRAGAEPSHPLAASSASGARRAGA